MFVTLETGCFTLANAQTAVFACILSSKYKQAPGRHVSVITKNPDVSLSTGLKLGFTLLLLLLIGLTAIGLVQMASINQNIEQVVNENNVKADLAHDMRYALSDRAIIMHSITTLSDVFDQQDAFDRFNEDAATFTNARNRFMKMPLNAAEETILADIRQITIKTQPLVVRAISLAMNGEDAEATTLIAAEIVPLQKQLSSRLEELIKLQKQEAERAVQKTANTYANTRLLMFLFGGGATLLGLIIALVVIRHASRQAAQLQHQAMYDSLTQLPNRVLFADRLQQAILIGRREKQPFALLAMDLDRFKEINDTLGHHAGDQVLQHVAVCLRSCLRESDTVARMGGDEFAILLAPVSDLDGALAAAKKILQALEKPATIVGQEIEVGASLGIVLFPEHGEDAQALMREADAAMYLAKQTHSGYQVYNLNMGQGADEHLTLQGELRHAIGHNELVLHFQPKIDFSSGCISGVEALVRWQHPQHGLLAPDHFIPMAEQTGLIKPLTYHVLRSALRQCEEWQRAGLELSMSVNISAVNIQDPEFPEQVAKLLKEFTVPPARLELEVTETALMSEPVRAVDCIKKLSALGLQIAIDDFGTGYASMAYLKEMLVAKIKIDKSFVKNMAVNHNDAMIVRSTVELGHNLGLKVVAEGVEDQAVWDKLKALGCDDAQGYHMGRPLPADGFSEWLRHSPWGLKAGN
jgi:diguanylate cyclase (GGDEF)-like protein